MRGRSNIWFYLLAVLVIVIDQVSKAIARNVLGDGRVIKVIPGFFDLRLDFNSGAAFGILPNWAPLFILIGLIAIFFIFRVRKSESSSRVFTTGLALLLGGALGNVIDRLVSSERVVTDFLSVQLHIFGNTHVWPTFNIADIAIVAGVILVLFHVYILERWKSDSEEPASE